MVSDLVKLALKRFDGYVASSEEKDFLRQAIRYDLRFNIDMLGTSSLQKEGVSSASLEKVASVLKLDSLALLQLTNTTACSILEGESKKRSRNIEIPEEEESAPQAFPKNQEEFYQKSAVWLYEFVCRKINVLQEIVAKDLTTPLNIQLSRRLRNIRWASVALLKKLD